MIPIKIDNKVYYAEDLVGLTLHASQKVPLMRFPYDNEPVVQYVERGNPIGKIHSWVDPDYNNGRTNLWFQFYDPNGQIYHVENLSGRFSLSVLDQQIEDNKTPPDTLDRVARVVTGTVLTWGAIRILSSIIK